MTWLCTAAVFVGQALLILGGLGIAALGVLVLSMWVDGWGRQRSPQGWEAKK